jgi:hypothetical protein
MLRMVEASLAAELSRGFQVGWYQLVCGFGAAVECAVTSTVERGVDVFDVDGGKLGSPPPPPPPSRQ